MTPEPINKAAEVYAEQYKMYVSSEGLENIQSDFIAGALHPDTEAYYREKLKEEHYPRWVSDRNPKMSYNYFVQVYSERTCNGHNTTVLWDGTKWLIQSWQKVISWLQESPDQ